MMFARFFAPNGLYGINSLIQALPHRGYIVGHTPNHIQTLIQLAF